LVNDAAAPPVVVGCFAHDGKVKVSL